jgi:hypothetical protein
MADKMKQWLSEGCNPSKWLKADPDATLLRVQSTCGKPFSRSGRIYTSEEPQYVPIGEFDARQLNEMLGAHHKGTLSVEQVKRSGDVEERVAPAAEPPTDYGAMNREDLIKACEEKNLLHKGKTKARMAAELSKAEEIERAKE